jgi:hypothetical protein
MCNLLFDHDQPSRHRGTFPGDEPPRPQFSADAGRVDYPAPVGPTQVGDDAVGHGAPPRTGGPPVIKSARCLGARVE